MSSMPSTRVRVTVLGAVVAVAAVMGVFGHGLETTASAQPAAPATPNNFMGGNPAQMDAKAIRTLRLKFPAGSRSNWHSHSHGQLLMAEAGKGRTQDRGGPLMEVVPGQPWFTKAGIEHWHGAAPDEAIEQLTIYEGEVKWLEPVTDVVYKAAPIKK
jgi:quercetin dioxygenase-like cupin family protein